MARCRFLTIVADPRPDHIGVVYGPGHETDFVQADYEFVMGMRLAGQVEIIDSSGLPTIPPPEGAPEGVVVAQEPFDPTKK